MQSAETPPTQPDERLGVTSESVPTKYIYALKAVGIFTASMVLLAFVFCLVQGTKKHTIYLLATNLIMSSLVGVANGWWYKTGDLSADKFWFVMLVCGVILFQCITTDIFVFNFPTHSGDGNNTLTGHSI